MTGASGAEAFDQLKHLLLGETVRRLDDADQRIERIDSRVGDKEKTAVTVGDALVEALAHAEVTRGREMSAAIAPVVVGAIRTEIKNSKDMMVEALYPITGRLVTAAVSNAFSELIDNLNARIDAMTSADSWRLRLRALASGRTMAEVALAESEAGRLKRALLLERGSGRVLATWPDRTGDGENVDLASGMIAAITEFASSVYADTGGELRMLDLGSSHVFLRASPRVIVAAEFGGDLSGNRESRLDEAFLSIVERHEQDESACGPEVIGGLLDNALVDEPAKPRSKTPVVVFGLIVAGLATWAAWGPVTRGIRENRINSAFAAAMAPREHLAQFPIRLEIDHGGERVILRGLAANDEEPRAVAEAITPASKPYRVERDVSVIALAAQAETLRAGEARAAATLQEAQQQIDRLRDELREARSVFDSPRARLQRFISDVAVFFTAHENLVDPSAVGEKLNVLADLLKETGSELRIVGHADDIGSSVINRSVSRKRADTVAAMLVARGVPQERLSLVARSTFEPIADSALEKTRSRRVTFELPYVGEFGIK